MPEVSEGAVQKRITGELESLQEQSQFRALEIIDRAAGGINLSSNDYLGLATDPRLKQALMESVAHAESVGSTGSRLLSGNSREWETLESEFAGFAGTEAALYFGSGYAANVGLLSSLLRPERDPVEHWLAFEDPAACDGGGCRDRISRVRVAVVEGSRAVGADERLVDFLRADRCAHGEHSARQPF